MQGKKGHDRSIITERIQKYKPGACTEQELSLMDKLLQITPQQEYIPDILKIFNPNFREQEQEKKKSLNDLLSNIFQSTYDQICEENQNLYVYKIVSNPQPNQSPEVTMKVHDSYACKYYKIAAEILKSKVYILQTCTLNILKALQTYIEITKQKETNRQKSKGISVLQSRIQQRSFLQVNRSVIANEYSINNSGIILQNQQSMAVRQLQSQQQQQRRKHRLEISMLHKQNQQAKAALEEEINSLKTRLKQVTRLKDHQYAYSEGKIAQLQYQLDQCRFQISRSKQQKEQFIQQREKLRSTNFEIKTKLSHVIKEKEYNESNIKAIEQNLQKIAQHYKDMQSEEEKQFRQTTIDQLQIARNHISSLEAALELKGEQINNNKFKYENSLEEQRRKTQEHNEQNKRIIQEQIKKKYEQKKKVEFNGILVYFEQIYKSMEQKENQLQKQQENQLANIKIENIRLQAQNNRLSKQLSIFSQAQQYEQRFNQGISNLEHMLKQLSLRESQLEINSSKISQPTNRYSREIHQQLEMTFGQMRTKLKELEKRNQELQRQQMQSKSKIAISQSLLVETEQELKNIQQKQKKQIMENRQSIIALEKKLQQQQDKTKLLQQAITLKNIYLINALNDSSILSNQYQKKIILIDHIEKFMKTKILKSQLKYHYNPISLNFGYHLTMQVYPFVILFKLAKSGKIMGFFSSGLILSKQSDISPDVFIFGLQHQGYFYQKAPKSSYQASARFIDNILTLGNNQLSIRNNNDQRNFQIFTSILGQQYFRIRNPDTLFDQVDINGYKVEYSQMQIHRIYF